MCLSENSALVKPTFIGRFTDPHVFPCYLVHSGFAKRCKQLCILLKCMAFLPCQSILPRHSVKEGLWLWGMSPHPSTAPAAVRAAALWPSLQGVLRCDSMRAQLKSQWIQEDSINCSPSAAALGEMPLTLCSQWAYLLFIKLNYDAALKVSVKQVGSSDDALHFMRLFLWTLWCKHTGSSEANVSVQ